MNLRRDFFRFCAYVTGRSTINFSLESRQLDLGKDSLDQDEIDAYSKKFSSKTKKRNGQKKLEKIEFSHLHNEQCKQQQLYYYWIDGGKFNRYSAMIIFGTLGNLKDRWNIWTFGNLRFNFFITHYDSTHIHTKLCHYLIKYTIKK